MTSLNTQSAAKIRNAKAYTPSRINTLPRRLHIDPSLKDTPRDEMLSRSASDKKDYFELVQVKHATLLEAGTDIVDLLEASGDTSILSLIGATGVGKTTLTFNILRNLYDANVEKSQRRVPYVFVPAPADGEKMVSWSAFYTKILRILGSNTVKNIAESREEDGAIKVFSGRIPSLRALRDAVETHFIEYRTRILIIDEAFHLLRFGNYSAVMDTIKSLADSTGTKLILTGSYQLLDMVTEYGQVARRSEIVYFRRYMSRDQQDERDFRKVIEALQKHWPCEQVPEFHLISDMLLDASLGCIALLKDLMARVLHAQIKNRGVFKAEMLAKAAKSLALTKAIRQEIDAGEAKIQGAVYGQSAFSDSMIAEVNKRIVAAATSAQH